MGNFVEKFKFVSTSWKIIIPLGNSVGDHIWVIQIQIYNLAHPSGGGGVGGFCGGIVGSGWVGGVGVGGGVGAVFVVGVVG